MSFARFDISERDILALSVFSFRYFFFIDGARTNLYRTLKLNHITIMQNSQNRIALCLFFLTPAQIWCTTSSLPQ